VGKVKRIIEGSLSCRSKEMGISKSQLNSEGITVEKGTNQIFQGHGLIHGWEEEAKKKAY